MVFHLLARQSRPYLLASRAVSGTMNYAAAAGGSRGPPQQLQQHKEPATQTKLSTHGSAQKPRSPRQRSPNGHGQGYRKTEHATREEHKPNTGTEEELVYVLTLKLTDSLAHPMNLMRERYFPKRLNRTPAHLTLFHALPDSRFEALDGGLSQLSGSTKPFFVSTGKPFRMRLGVGINVGKGYNRMKQDQGGWKPHWTVMNKVNEEKKVDEAFQTVEKEMLEKVKEGQAIGLDLWRYDKGNWIFVNEYKFKG